MTSGIYPTRFGIPPFTSPNLNDGVRNLNDGVRNLNDGVRNLNDGVRNLNGQVP